MSLCVHLFGHSRACSHWTVAQRQQGMQQEPCSQLRPAAGIQHVEQCRLNCRALQGMQRNEPYPTIERDLEKAMFEAGAISESNAGSFAKVRPRYPSPLYGRIDRAGTWLQQVGC